jgi:hypothetical protein
LKPLFIEVNSVDYDFVNFNFNGNTSNQHCLNIKNQNYLNLTKNSAIPPLNKLGGLLVSDRKL